MKTKVVQLVSPNIPGKEYVFLSIEKKITDCFGRKDCPDIILIYSAYLAKKPNMAKYHIFLFLLDS